VRLTCEQLTYVDRLNFSDSLAFLLVGTICANALAAGDRPFDYSIYLIGTSVRGCSADEMVSGITVSGCVDIVIDASLFDICHPVCAGGSVVLRDSNALIFNCRFERTVAGANHPNLSGGGAI
jgi:hypothetical protein